MLGGEERQSAAGSRARSSAMCNCRIKRELTSVHVCVFQCAHVINARAQRKRSRSRSGRDVTMWLGVYYMGSKVQHARARREHVFVWVDDATRPRVIVAFIVRRLDEREAAAYT